MSVHVRQKKEEGFTRARGYIYRGSSEGFPSRCRGQLGVKELFELPRAILTGIRMAIIIMIGK